MADSKRPVIVSNRSVMKQSAADDDQTVMPTAPTLTSAGKKIVPIDASNDDSTANTKPELDIPGLPSAVTGKKESASASKKTAQPDKEEKTRAQQPDPKTSPEPVPDSRTDETEIEKKMEPTADPPSEPAPSLVATAQEEEKHTDPALETKASEPGTESGAASDDKPSVDEPKGEELPGQAQDQAAKEAAKLDEQAEQLMESEKYFLPINSVEKRRSKRFVLLGVTISAVLLLAWVDIALDASIIQIEGVKPVTHFFSS